MHEVPVMPEGPLDVSGSQRVRAHRATGDPLQAPVACSGVDERGPGDHRGDPFEGLLDEHFVAGASIREPSAAERQRAARAADLQRRLHEQAERERLLAARNRRVERRRNRSVRLKRLAGPLVVIALVVGGVWYTMGRGGSDPTASPSQSVLVQPTNRPPPDPSASEVPLGVPPPAPDPPGAFEFVRTQPEDDGPVAWDPCRPVRYVVNPTGAPPGSEAIVAAAIERTAAATGLTFIDAGSTDEKWSKDRNPYQPERYGDRWAPALIAWSTEAEVPGLAGYVAGMGGGTAVSDASGRSVYVTGQSVLDAEDLGELLDRPDGPAAVQAIVQHELGHLVGLDHVADPTQLMYSEGNPTSASDWGEGDLAGLSALGAGECFPEL